MAVPDRARLVSAALELAADIRSTMVNRQGKRRMVLLGKRGEAGESGQKDDQNHQTLLKGLLAMPEILQWRGKILCQIT